jgi:hypothetical protein
MSFGYSDLVDQLIKMAHYKIKFMKKNMMAKTKGPEMRMNVICISCPVELTTGAEIAED